MTAPEARARLEEILRLRENVMCPQCDEYLVPACFASAHDLARIAEHLRDEVARLNEWADGMTDRMLKERQTGEAYQQELRAGYNSLATELAASHERERKLAEELAGARKDDAPANLWDEIEYLATMSTQADAEAEFRRYFAKNYPPNTIISDPQWHAVRIWNSALHIIGMMPITYQAGVRKGRQDFKQQAIAALSAASLVAEKFGSVDAFRAAEESCAVVMDLKP